MLGIEKKQSLETELEIGGWRSFTYSAIEAELRVIWRCRVHNTILGLSNPVQILQLGVRQRQTEVASEALGSYTHITRQCFQPDP